MFGHPGDAEAELSPTSADFWVPIQAVNAPANTITGVFVSGKPGKDCVLVALSLYTFLKKANLAEAQMILSAFA